MNDASQTGITLKSSVYFLDVSPRTERAIENEGLKTIGDVVAISAKEWLRVPNFGTKSLKNLVRELARHGFKLRDMPSRRTRCPTCDGLGHILGDTL